MANANRETARGDVFISWSGKRSLYVANFFYGWLKKVLQRSAPWMSENDIDKGTVGVEEIRKALAGTQVGVFFLTPENRESMWMPYEAGSLMSETNDKSRVWTYLLGGMQIQHIRGPFGMFQHTLANREDTLRLIRSINKVIDGPTLSDSLVDEVFDTYWPELESHLKNMPEAETAKPLPSPDEMTAEILELSRAAANRGKQAEWLDQLAAENKDFFPLFFQLLKGLNIPQLLASAAPSTPPPVEPKSTFCIKLVGDSEIKRVEGTAAAVTAKGEVAVVVGNAVVARFESVEGWWREIPDIVQGILNEENK